jgi:fatty-acyl-CoA synthase
VLADLGISADGRVATFAWNTARHLELYFAAPCTGRVLHTLNIRLFPEQLTYIVNHAEDEVIFVDRSLLGLLAPCCPRSPRCGTWCSWTTARATCPTTWPASPARLRGVAGRASPVEFAVDDEHRAASMCYTSGTTGNPKGVVYSHRSTFLHTFGAMTADSLGARESDVILPVVPMFHANAWGLAHAGVASGASLVMPGPDLSGKAIADLIVEEKVTVAAGVPTIWMQVLPELKGRDTSSLRAIPCGGSAVPKALSEAYREQLGLPILQAWGMTETSPIAAVCTLDADERSCPSRSRPSCAPWWVGSRSVWTAGWSSRAAPRRCRGTARPAASCSVGATGSRPPTTTTSGRGRASPTTDGCVPATWPPWTPGRIRLVDRTKDLIKSGGEWISSVELENELMAHPKIREAAVIGVPHPRWSERPLACVVMEPGAELTKDEVLDFLAAKVAKWQLPTTWCSSTRCPRPAWASSPRRPCATASPTTFCPTD